MIPKLRNCKNLRGAGGIFVITCGICRGVDEANLQTSLKPRKFSTKIKPVLVVVRNKVSTSTLVVVLIEPDVRLGWLAAAAHAVEHVCG